MTWGLTAQLRELQTRVAELEAENASLRDELYVCRAENKRLRTAIETAVGACTCRSIEPCDGCFELRANWGNG